MNRDYRSKNNPHSYRCKYCRGNESVTSKKSFSGTKLDAYLEEQVLQILDNLNHEALSEKYNSRNVKRLDVLHLKHRELVNTHASKQRALQKAQERLEACILNDSPDSTIDAVSKMIGDIDAELLGIEEQLESLNNDIESVKNNATYQESLIQEVLSAKEIYKSATIAQKKAILHLLINRIEVTDVDSADIYLNI